MTESAHVSFKINRFVDCLDVPPWPTGLRRLCFDPEIVGSRLGGNFIFRNPARNCTIIIAYCVNNLQCIGYFLLFKKIDELTSKNGSMRIEPG